jgi:serine/threonine protein phosphatase PrpC
MTEFDLSGGEMFLLCSDGLHGVLEDGTLAEMLSDGGTPAEIVPRMIEAALAKGGKDNVTALLVRYTGAQT